MPGSWKRFAGECPALAVQAARVLSQEQGTALLATVAADGTPRIGPVTLVVVPDGLYLAVHFCSDELTHLRAHPECELHSASCAPGDEELVVRGSAVELADPIRRALVADPRPGAHERDRRKVLLALEPSWVSWVMWQGRRRHEVSWQAEGPVAWRPVTPA